MEPRAALLLFAPAQNKIVKKKKGNFVKRVGTLMRHDDYPVAPLWRWWQEERKKKKWEKKTARKIQNIGTISSSIDRVNRSVSWRKKNQENSHQIQNDWSRPCYFSLTIKKKNKGGEKKACEYVASLKQNTTSQAWESFSFRLERSWSTY